MSAAITATADGISFSVDLEAIAAVEREYREAQARGQYYGRQWPCVINGEPTTFDPEGELPDGIRDYLVNYTLPFARVAVYAAKDRIYAAFERSRDITGYRDQTEHLTVWLEIIEEFDDMLASGFRRSNSMTMLPPSDPESGVYAVVAPKDAPVGRFERITERPKRCG